MEVCIDSVESAINALKGGASRVELCSSLLDGGTTPSIGMLTVVKQVVKIPVYVMLRPRGGDFCYSKHELDVMKIDLQEMKKHHADGFVFGILETNGSVSENACQELVDLAKPLPCTFHRAIDMSSDLLKAVDVIKSLGFTRILTSGGESTALEGAPMIRAMVNKSNNEVIIVAGGGITERNLNRILLETGVKEFHCSARSTIPSPMVYQNPCVSMGASYGPSEFSTKRADANVIERLTKIYMQLSM